MHRLEGTQEQAAAVYEKMETKYDVLAKIVIIGDGGVGKTSVITRFTQEQFIYSYVATIGVDFRSKVLRVNDRRVKMQIWDTAGQERFRNITQAYYRGASGILLAFSLVSTSSFENIEKWLSQIEQAAPKDCCKLLVGCKSDDGQARVVDRQVALKLAEKLGISYMECSSKTGDNVNQVFHTLGQLVLEKNSRQSPRKSLQLPSGGRQKRCQC